MLALGAIAALVNAVGVLLLGIAAVRTRRAVGEVHDAVRTSDGRTIGEMIEHADTIAADPNGEH